MQNYIDENIKKHVVILKNDAVGDLVHSIPAIYKIIVNKQVSRITLFLSNQSKDFAFFFDNKKVKVEILNCKLNLFQKFKVFNFFLLNKIDCVYILTPKNFFFYLPLIFRKVKFFALCLNNINNYKRPNSFLRKFLFKYKINDRSAVFKRESTLSLQLSLCDNKENYKNITHNFNPKISDDVKKFIKKKYFYFHLKKKHLNELGWDIYELKKLFNNFLEYIDYVYITKDIELDENTNILKESFNSYDFTTNKSIDKSSKIVFFDNIKGRDLYNVIKYSRKTIAFHGMMTNLASIEKKNILDLYHCKIKSWDDYRNYRNAFYEFKPSYKGYDFSIPNKNIHKTIKKITYSLKKND